MAYPSSLRCLQEKWVLLKYLVTRQLMPDMQTRQPGNPNMDSTKGVTHAEPDSLPGEEQNPNMPTHLEGVGPKLLMNEEDDQLLKVEEDGTATKTVSVEGGHGPLHQTTRAWGQLPCHTREHQVTYLV